MVSTTDATLRSRALRPVAQPTRASEAGRRGLRSPLCGSPSPRRHGAQTPWSIPHRTQRSPMCSPSARSPAHTLSKATTIKELPANDESDLVMGKATNELDESDLVMGKAAEPVAISGKELDLLIKSGELAGAAHGLAGPVWFNVAMLLTHWYMAIHFSSYMRIPTFVPAWMGPGQEAPFEFRATIFAVLIMVGIVHHACPILHINFGFSFDTLDKVFGALVGTFLLTGVPCLFSAYYDIFDAANDATVWYGLIFAFFLVAGVIPELAKPLCLVKQGPTPERAGLPELVKQATQEQWAWTWHVVLDGSAAVMYAATWMCMGPEDKAKLMAWAF
mmetsp:Transcript_10446/g.21955  ORF Transcript_10446/g.21955 Transcript_10446/m.21955 type:complete len:333 (-) Transcript_10446:83-1081(-)|eukprot:CAMPEP_0182526720 /NCGR_PEP_ID=MMETSP1323-20130603/3387_1 /TAXON_ID=236787 /ORGANISM="Florenciella parvula, Strain RCC1693" /LENGTH=332 /DNA_ID=CAMNT_0024735625 /DNA_START=81 /DNA_END=1079 /DNA_ORIENTATION=-